LLLLLLTAGSVLALSTPASNIVAGFKKALNCLNDRGEEWQLPT
jgi:hypothetical protein